MNIVVISNLDYNFSAKISKICNDNDDDIFFCDSLNELAAKQISDSLVVIDYDDSVENIDKIRNMSKKLSKVSFCIIMKDVNSSVQKKLTNYGCDLVMSKQSFLINFSTIKKQFLLKK